MSERGGVDMWRKITAPLLAVVLLLAAVGCGREPSAEGPPPSSSEEVASPASSEPVDGDVPIIIGWLADREIEELHPYLRQLVEETAAAIATPEMGEYQRVKAAFDYMIRHVAMGEPAGLDLWRVHGGGDTPISFVEERAISPLKYGIGMCEDYAAALTLLLRGMGLEARYVPGLTYSAEGNLVDHAWTVVKIDGSWYHLDSQLEDNISRHGWVRYRYFLRGDATLSSSHRWGQNLIDAGLLTEEQNRELGENWTPPPCPGDYPTPERYDFEADPAPDPEVAARQAAGEIAAWEKENGPLPAMELNVIPPVFGLEGYGPPDEG